MIIVTQNVCLIKIIKICFFQNSPKVIFISPPHASSNSEPVTVVIARESDVNWSAITETPNIRHRIICVTSCVTSQHVSSSAVRSLKHHTLPTFFAEKKRNSSKRQRYITASHATTADERHLVILRWRGHVYGVGLSRVMNEVRRRNNLLRTRLKKSPATPELSRAESGVVAVCVVTRLMSSAATLGQTGLSLA